MSSRKALVDAAALETWATGHVALPALLELIVRLLQSEAALDTLHPQGTKPSSGPGWDLVSTARGGSDWVPEGDSVWALSTGVYNSDTAAASLGNFLKEPGHVSPKHGSFVFVTPRRWPGKWKWLADARHAAQWKGIRVYDADDLAAWLAEAPEATLWFLATQIGDPEAREGWIEPDIPWNPDAFRSDSGALAWLSWNTRMSELVGRQDEKAQLTSWAGREDGVRFRFLVGEGGIGKTRLAYEVAAQLRSKGWVAGFVPLDVPLPFDAGPFGSFLILDRPEENRAATLERLREIARRPNIPSRNLCVLFISREIDDWDKVIDEAGAAHRRDPTLILTERIEPRAVWELFSTVLSRVSRMVGSEPNTPSLPQVSDWLTRDPFNQRAVAVAAAAVAAALRPEPAALELSGAQAILWLVEQERIRLMGLSVTYGFEKQALERLAALSAMRGGLDTATIERLASPTLRLGLGSTDNVKGRLKRAGVLSGGVLPPPGPRIMAAALAALVLADCDAVATKWLWTVFDGAETDTFVRVGQLICDSEIVLDLQKGRLGDLLADMVRSHPERARRFADQLLHSVPAGVTGFSATVWSTLAAHAESDVDRARSLHNLSIDLFAQSKVAEALAAIGEAVAIHRTLALSDPDRFEPGLPNRLNTLSVCLAATGDDAGAREAAREAVDILRRLATSNPAAPRSELEVDLAYGLNTLSNRLADSGQTEEALTAIHEAVAVRRRLVSSNPAEHESGLALSLSNLSSRLLACGKGDDALAAASEAVAIRRRLAAMNKAVYGADLASSLNILSDCLLDREDTSAAAAAMHEALDILRPLAETAPARFKPTLAAGLDRLSNCLAAIGDGSGALKAAREAVALGRDLAASDEARFAPLLATALTNLAKRLYDAGEPDRAIETIRKALPLHQGMLDRNSARFQGEWSAAVTTYAGFLAERNKVEDALRVLDRAIQRIRPALHDAANSAAQQVLHELQKLQERLRRSDPTQGGRVLGVEELLELAFFLVLDGWATPSFLVTPTPRAYLQALQERRKEMGPAAPSDLLETLRADRGKATPDPLWLAWTLETQIGTLRKIRAELFGADRIRTADRTARTSDASTSLDQTVRQRPEP